MSRFHRVLWEWKAFDMIFIDSNVNMDMIRY
jgi:hypothetical protein